MRAHDAPNATAIPNFQTVHLDFSVDALPDPFSSDRSGSFDGADALCRTEPPEVAFYRGGQPTAEGRAWMVSRGFKTIVDLRFEDRDNQWTRPLGGVDGKGGKVGHVESQLEVVHIPVTDMEPPSFEAVERFIEIANDETKRPMLVHCKAGIGRTGSMVSCWRSRAAWTSLADVRKESEARRRKGGDPIYRVVEASASVDLSDDGKSVFEQPAKSESRTRGGSFYEGAGFHEDDFDNVSADRVPATSFGPEGTGSGGVRADEPVAIGEHSDLDQAPDMYVIRTDGFTCTQRGD